MTMSGNEWTYINIPYKPLIGTWACNQIHSVHIWHTHSIIKNSYTLLMISDEQSKH